MSASNDYRSPLAKVKGLGRSPDATRFFWVQKLTAIALIPLTLWFCYSIATLPELTYEVLIAWLKSPFNAVMASLLTVVSLKHGVIGMQVIFEDYIHTHGLRFGAILFTKLLSYFMMALGVYSILRLSLGN